MTKKTMNPNLDVIMTASGVELNFMVPSVNLINAYDIAKGLAHKGHFAGQTHKMFTIAEHSLLVAHLALANTTNTKVEKVVFLLGLLHDAAESYINDMLSPIKKHSSVYKAVEDSLLISIYAKYNLLNMPDSILSMVKEADDRAKEIEFDCFYNDAQSDLILYYSPEEAFNRYYYRLIRAINEYKETL